MQSDKATASVEQQVIQLERQALQRWCNGDPSGFLEISAPDVVYFDPFLERRIDGRAALTDYYQALRGKIFAERFELLNPLVQLVGSAAVLTFNFLSWGGEGDEHHWNCTEVYRQSGSHWEIIQTHWSFTKTFEVSYRLMKPGEEAGIVDLVLKVFTQFVAPEYSPEGIAEFMKFARNEDLRNRIRAGDLVLLAESGQNVIGAIEIRENSHIALLFVENSCQRKGIGKELIRRSIEISRTRKPDISRFTVNSSPNAVKAYKKMGFKSLGGERVVNDIRFIPMELSINKK
jgi:GNAT superfamily N-acetyltransferase